MAFSLSTKQQRSIRCAVRIIEGKRSELDRAVRKFNDKMEELFGEIETKNAAFTKAAADLRSIVEGAVTDWRSEWDDRSVRWQESDRGEAASVFIEAWDSFSQELPELSLEKPEPLEVGTLPNLEDMPLKAAES